MFIKFNCKVAKIWVTMYKIWNLYFLFSAACLLKEATTDCFTLGLSSQHTLLLRYLNCLKGNILEPIQITRYSFLLLFWPLSPRVINLWWLIFRPKLLWNMKFIIKKFLLMPYHASKQKSFTSKSIKTVLQKAKKVCVTLRRPPSTNVTYFLNDPLPTRSIYAILSFHFYVKTNFIWHRAL